MTNEELVANEVERVMRAEGLSFVTSQLVAEVCKASSGDRSTVLGQAANVVRDSELSLAMVFMLVT